PPRRTPHERAPPPHPAPGAFARPVPAAAHAGRARRVRAPRRHRRRDQKAPGWGVPRPHGVCAGPAPRARSRAGPAVSPVRMWTLIGGIAGCAFGAWLTLYMSYDWPIVVGGKPIGSIPPYVVIMFEMTVLFGALSTIIGIVFNAAHAARRLGTIAWDPRFTNDKFGVFVPCGADKA